MYATKQRNNSMCVYVWEMVVVIIMVEQAEKWLHG